MHPLVDLVSQLDSGFLHKRDLAAAGASDRYLTHAVRDGRLRRPRRGWYTALPASDPRFLAVRVGGRLTGVSALAYLGAWLREREPPIVVSVAPNASRLRRVAGVRVVWDTRAITQRGTAWSVDPWDALREALLHVPFEEAIALVDWALHTKHLQTDDVGDLCRGLPRDIALIEAWVDPNCESYLESITRTRLRLAGHHVTSQHRLPNGQRIDLVVDDVVGLETDGRAFHGASFEADRLKDLSIAIDGRTPLRVSYRMVEQCWGRILEAVEAAVVQHRRGALVCADNSGRARVRPGNKTRAWRLAAAGLRRRPELPTPGARGPGGYGAGSGGTAAGGAHSGAAAAGGGAHSGAAAAGGGAHSGAAAGATGRGAGAQAHRRAPQRATLPRLATIVG
jgi:very-short-patch-repair endonuclease